MNNSINREVFDEGLGTVYERFMLNDYFDRLMDAYPVHNILEVPIYGMTGLTGINSVHFAEKGRRITLVDTEKDNISEAENLLKILPINGKYQTLLHEDLSRLPFDNNSFDLVWNFAAMWHVNNADLLLNEMVRVSSEFVLIFVPNRKQPGYALRKYVFDKEFFDTIDESWNDISRITEHLKSKGMNIVDEGLIDIPFWPDTAVPVKNVLKKIFKEKNDNNKKSGQDNSKGLWNWDIMNYYMGNNPQLKDTMNKFSFIEKMPVPRQLKAFWAHHMYVLCSKKRGGKV